MTYTLEAYTNARFAEVEDSIHYADAVDRACEELDAMDDLELVQAYIDTLGNLCWADAREALIETALENMPELSDSQWSAQRERLIAMPDDLVVPACKRAMTNKSYRVAATLYMPERTVNVWSDWRDRFIDQLAEQWMKDQQRQAFEGQYA